jgi:hypothetical protein
LIHPGAEVLLARILPASASAVVSADEWWAVQDFQRSFDFNDLSV